MTTHKKIDIKRKGVKLKNKRPSRSGLHRVASAANKKAQKNAKAAKKPAQSANAKKLRQLQSNRARASKKAENKKAEEKLAAESVLEEIRKIGDLLENRGFLQHIDRTAGEGCTDILRTLVKGPHTDEDISTRLNLKVNDVRRMLNVMNGHSIVRYDVNKDNKGWLIFKWRIDGEKLKDYIANMEVDKKDETPELQGDCNDFFMCKKCYVEQKVVVPFDSAFESGFACNSCGKPYTILNRDETVALFKETVADKQQVVV